MQYLGFEAYEKSINEIEGSTVFMAKDGEATVLVIAPKEGTAAKPLGIKGSDMGGGKLKAPLSSENAKVFRKLFPFTAPVRVLAKPRSFGLGDRLGIATPGHIRLFEKLDVFPIFAQQSIRELNLTNRTYEDVLDAATFAVYREGFRKGFGADGDQDGLLVFFVKNVFAKAVKSRFIFGRLSCFDR